MYVGDSPEKKEEGLKRGLEIAERVWDDLKNDGFHLSDGKKRDNSGLRIMYDLFMKILAVNSLTDRVFEVRAHCVTVISFAY